MFNKANDEFETAVRERVTKVVLEAFETRGTRTDTGHFLLSTAELDAAGITARRISDTRERLASVTDKYEAKHAAGEIADVLLADMANQDAVLNSMLGR